MSNPNDDPGVYFVGSESGPVKIGFSNDVFRRFRALRNSSPVPLYVLAARSGSRVVEREYHRRFARFRIHGEWFERTPELEAEIESVNRGEYLKDSAA